MSASDSLSSHQFEVHEINKAIEGYAARAGAPGDTVAAPYNSASLAEIYHPRVRQLMDLQSQGFTHARWGWDADSKQNRWHGAAHQN